MLLSLLLLRTEAYILMRNRGGSFTAGVIKSTQYHFLQVKLIMHLKYILWNKIHGSSVGVLHLAWFKHVSFFPVLSNPAFLAPSALPGDHYSIWVWSNAMTDPIQGTSWNVRRTLFFISLSVLLPSTFSNGSGVVFVWMCVSVCSIFFLWVLEVPDLEHPHISTVLSLYPTHCIHWSQSQLESRIDLQRPKMHYCHAHPENPSLCCDGIFVYIAPYVAEYTSSAEPQTILS